MLIQTVLIVILGIVLLGIIALSFFYSVSGMWERTVDEGSGESARERISIGQFGPFVVGRRELAGGYQSFFGFALANHFWIRRRDYGVAAITKQGFPQEIAKQLEGQVMVRFKMHLSSDRLFLQGMMTPYQVEFTHQPPRVTGMLALPPVARKYRRIELVSAKAVAPADAS